MPENNTPEVKRDCFAYSENKSKCTILKETYCRKEICKFYKTDKELSKQNIKATIMNNERGTNICL